MQVRRSGFRRPRERDFLHALVEFRILARAQVFPEQPEAREQSTFVADSIVERRLGWHARHAQGKKVEI